MRSDALKDLLKKKQHGERISAPTKPQENKVTNLMDALRAASKAARRRVVRPGSERVR